jgi:predicted dehydrogenase
LKVAADLGRLEIHSGVALRTDMDKPLRIGIIGLGAERGWATAAHLPALHALSGDFELAGVANTSLASAQAAATAFGLPRAFESTAELVASPDVDVVVVTVKVPYHRELVSEALNAGKSVYCEWPLGNGLALANLLALHCR